VGSHLPRGPRSGVEVDIAALQQARLDAGLSLAQVAGADLSRQAVHLIERGKVRPSRRSLRIIADRLGVPEWTLLASGDGANDERAITELEAQCRRQEYPLATDHAQRIIATGGSDELMAHCHHFAGLALYQMARPAEALPHLREARVRFESLRNPWLAAEAIDWEAMALHMQEDAGALRVARRALRRYRSLEAREPETEARMLEHLGTLCLGRRDHRSGRQWYEAALGLDGGVRDLVRMARIYHGLGMCHHGLGDQRRAAELLAKAATLYEAEQRITPSPMRMGLPMAEADLGLVVMEQGDLQRAEELFLAALDHYDVAGIEHLQSHTLLNLGELRQRQRRLDEGLDFVVRAIGCASAHGEMLTVAAGHRQLGELHEARGDHEQADSAFRRALGMLREAGVEERAAEVALAYEQVLAERRQPLGRSRSAEA
jgi:tetratricopeptide (TPR) repeat protein